MYDLIIIGGGPAGIAAGIYAARKKIKTLIIVESFGGQSVVSADIQNWIGSPSISGYDLAKSMENHLRSFDGSIEIEEGERAEKIEQTEGGFKVATSGGKSFETKYILLASGSRRKRLGVPGEDKYDGKGVVFCSICDAPLFKDKEVAVIGGGNAGLEAVVDLFPYAKKIYLVVRSEGPKGDPVTLEKVSSNAKVEIITQADTEEILGDNFVTGLRYKDRKEGALKELKVSGVFVEVGALPNSEIVKGLADINAKGEVISDPRTQATSNPGIWAAGDVSDALYKQNNTSAGDAIKAALNIYDKLVRG
jgi:alkyl hydroperoxide reductase subunit F